MAAIFTEIIKLNLAFYYSIGQPITPVHVLTCTIIYVQYKHQQLSQSHYDLNDRNTKSQIWPFYLEYWKSHLL